MNYQLHFIENTEACRVCENKNKKENDDQSKNF